MRERYGAGPLHLAAAAACFAAAGYAIARIFAELGDPVRVMVWLAGSIVAHDLVLFPLYAAIGVMASGILVPAGERSRLRIAALNHLRVPALASGLLLLVWFPLVTERAPRTYERLSALTVDVYLERWLIASGALFAASGLIFALRARGLARQS
jgi:hypothetical protein